MLATERPHPPLETIRHTAAHLLAHAVKDLYPETLVAIGPATETGFYYDFDRATPFTPDDLATGGARKIRRDGRAVQSRDHRVDPPGRGNHSLHGWKLHRSLPRAARRTHRPSRGGEGHERRRGLLARRRAQPDATTDLRDGLSDPGRARRPPHAFRRSRQARSPQTRDRTRPLQHRRRRRRGAR